MSAVIPATYHEWRHCIEVDCGLALNTTFIKGRLAALATGRSDEARRFAQLYGAPHLQRVVDWFERARTDAAPI